MSVHRIRLRGPWEVAPADGGRVRYLRRFGRPRTLEPGETVWITGPALSGPARVAVNGTALGTAVGAIAFEITSLLLPRNELTVEADEASEAILSEMALEVRGAKPGPLAAGAVG